MSRNWWPRAATPWMFGVRGHLLQKRGVTAGGWWRAGQGLIILPPGNCASVHTLTFSSSYPFPVQQGEFSGLWFSMARSNRTELDSQSSEKHQHACLSLSFFDWLVGSCYRTYLRVGFPPFLYPTNTSFGGKKERPPCLLSQASCALVEIWCLDDLGPSTLSLFSLLKRLGSFLGCTEEYSGNGFPFGQQLVVGIHVGWAPGNCLKRRQKESFGRQGIAAVGLQEEPVKWSSYLPAC